MELSISFEKKRKTEKKCKYPKKPGRETVMTAMTRASTLPTVSDIQPKKYDPNNIPSM